MIIERLADQLTSLVSRAEEIWVAVALMTPEGYGIIKKHIPMTSKQHYLVGIDLQTPLSVLEDLQKRQSPGKMEVSIPKYETGIFHPKVYIFKIRGQYVAIIGSANLTRQALEVNIEISYKITDQKECEKLVMWYNTVSAESFPLTEANLAAYKNYITKIPKQAELPDTLLLSGMEEDEQQLSKIDFALQFFKKEHHMAFRKSNWKNRTEAANNERQNASNRFLELHEQIFPQFQDNGMGDLYPNVKPHIVSMYYHHNETYKQIDAMWLSYGKSQEEIKRYRQAAGREKVEESDLLSFINHARLQIRIDLAEVGIWILFGKNNGGSLYDREFFKNKMKSQTYKNEFFDMIKRLPDQYWFSINGENRFVKDFADPEELNAFCKKDRQEAYFIIGRNYKLGDHAISEQNLAFTTINEFKRLIPIYRKMRHYF